jgi:hypothetical protein
MLPVIYTTYGIAMRHRPEVLAGSGGLKSAGVGRMFTSPSRRMGACVRQWLETILVRVRLRHRDMESRTVQSSRAPTQGALPLVRHRAR